MSGKKLTTEEIDRRLQELPKSSTGPKATSWTPSYHGRVLSNEEADRRVDDALRGMDKSKVNIEAAIRIGKH